MDYNIFDNGFDSFSSELVFDSNNSIFTSEVSNEIFIRNKEEINFRPFSNSINISSLENNIEIENNTKNKSLNKITTNSKILNDCIPSIQFKENKKFRKDAYYKHFKALFGKSLKNKINQLKNRCFPSLKKNEFSTPSYKYIGNPKEKDNYIFLNYKIKDLLIYGKDSIKQNRQDNNEKIINYIENNNEKAKDKMAYETLIIFLNDTLENIFIQFYNDKNQFRKIENDKDCIFYDKIFKKQTGISLLEKNGFIKAVSRKIKQ